ncbi:Membrane protein YdfJ [Corynebacterium capitovis DSM 44611]|uniref:MMPL family transporter n=1 Tax=Corynebacterium capitovis TaxID=131081 RepID=UPI00037CC94B|nr:MMPL family transporter [Corynebacterium capitovis]WKD56645.1 Membrane protein YdfJ [Corynebacterium capitovis DSM 44611]
MAHLLYRLGRSAYTHRWRFIAVWLLILIGAGTAAATLMKPTTTNMTIPGLESLETSNRIQEIFGGDNPMQTPSGTVVVRATDGTLAESQDDLASLIQDVQSKPYLKDTQSIVDPVTAAAGMQQQLSGDDLAAVSPLSENGRTGTFQITFDAPSSQDVSTADRDDLTATLERHSTGNVEIAYSGNVFQAQEISGASEVIGLLVAALVLIITFGSLLAAGLPLLSAVVGVGTGMGLIFAGTSFTDSINSLTPTLASMVGLAVGIDYALFIVSRFRNELVAYIGRPEMEPKELAQELKRLSRDERAHLAGLAVGKAGTAVSFAGLTVLIALAALSIINIPFLTAMALAAALTVAIAVLVALTLLPAVLGAFGTKVFAGRVPVVKAPDPENEQPTMGLKWVRQVRKRPAAFLVGAVLVLGLLALPALQMRLAMPTDSTSALGTPTRTAAEWIDEDFGPGRNAPMTALLDSADGSFIDALADVQSVEGVKHAQLIAATEDGKYAQLLITPEYAATDERTSGTLQSLRDGGYEVTGVTPIYDDISNRLSDVLIPYIAIVVLLAFVLLMVVFRSIWVPLIAALGFALSVAATFGVTVGIWQEGWLGINNDPQPLLSFLPIMLIGIVFGLAMDYQVFLVTRMREGYVHGKTAGNAVSNGFKHGARVVTAAALIMISVFAAFMLMDEPFIKVMGSALAMAVLFDAFLVRMTIVPATLFLLGDRAWTLPRWLDKILPRVDVEGESL